MLKIFCEQIKLKLIWKSYRLNIFYNNNSNMNHRVCEICQSNNVFVLLHTKKCFKCITQKEEPNRTQLMLAYIYGMSAGNTGLSSSLDPCSFCKKQNITCINLPYRKHYPDADKSNLIPKYGNNLCFECIVRIAEEEEYFITN